MQRTGYFADIPYPVDRQELLKSQQKDMKRVMTIGAIVVLLSFMMVFLVGASLLTG